MGEREGEGTEWRGRERKEGKGRRRSDKGERKGRGEGQGRESGHGAKAREKILKQTPHLETRTAHFLQLSNV